jgi:murein DD-endopeptidase MepM/ murein hydrolase activator NlpD
VASNRHAPAAPHGHHHEADHFGRPAGYSSYGHMAQEPLHADAEPSGAAFYAGHAASGPHGRPDASTGFAGAHRPPHVPGPRETREPHADAYGPQGDGPFEEWNPTADTVRPVRGRHRVVKQRGGMGRSGAVLGVGMMAAVGAGGLATANDTSPAAVAVPDMAALGDRIPDAADLPVVGDMVSGGGDEDVVAAGQGPLTQAGFTTQAAPEGVAPGAGDDLRARILAQAEQQQSAADRSAREEASAAAARAASEKAEAEREEAAERKREAAEEARRKAEAARLAELARSYTLPLGSYQLTSTFGDSGGMWENDHTGQDFAAPTGTPVKAVHSGTVKEAGWAGSYGYRIVLELDDGTEVWYCHLSSMKVAAGAEVTTKDVIGNVGSTGNSTGPHLHLEIRPGGGDAIDPLAWLRGKGQTI